MTSEEDRTCGNSLEGVAEVVSWFLVLVEMSW